MKLAEFMKITLDAGFIIEKQLEVKVDKNDKTPFTGNVKLDLSTWNSTEMIESWKRDLIILVQRKILRPLKAEGKLKDKFELTLTIAEIEAKASRKCRVVEMADIQLVMQSGTKELKANLMACISKGVEYTNELQQAIFKFVDSQV